MIKLLCTSAVAIVVLASAALAAGEKGGSALDNPDKMAPFYTDKDLKTMRSETEFQAAWMAQTKEDRDSITKECSDTDISKEHEGFCKMTKQLSGAD